MSSKMIIDIISLIFQTIQLRHFMNGFLLFQKTEFSFLVTYQIYVQSILNKISMFHLSVLLQHGIKILLITLSHYLLIRLTMKIIIFLAKMKLRIDFLKNWIDLDRTHYLNLNVICLNLNQLSFLLIRQQFYC